MRHRLATPAVGHYRIGFAQDQHGDGEIRLEYVAVSVVTGVSLANIRLSPSSTSDNILFLQHSFT